LKKVFMIFMAAFLFIGIAACGGKTTQAPTTQAPTTEAPTTQAPTTQAPTTGTGTTAVNTLPVLFGADDIELYVGDSFDPKAGVFAMDAEDGPVPAASIVVSGTVDLTTAGEYTLTYTVTDSDGGVTTATRVVTVLALDLVYPTGFFNFKFATTELRHTFMAAAEKYLMNNMYGGIPLFANGSFALYSERLQFPVDEYIPVMGFGTSFGTFSADDSTVLMDNGQPGNVGEYTYRTASSTSPEQWNQWLYQTSTDSDYMGVYMDALYTYEFNEEKTGYAVNPSMASGNPIPVNSYITETGKEVSKTWRIPLRTDLEWFYHPDTNISGLPAGHEVIDANDFVNTFKLALDKGWFRAISGGGDFVTSSNKIENAQAYRDGEATWEQVGIKVIDNHTIEFKFVEDQSEWNVRYWASSFVMTPINIDLFLALGGELDTNVNGSYGTSNKTIAYHGAYYVDYYEADKVLRYKENPNFHTPDKYFYTGYTFMVIAEAEVRFQEFIAGKLEGVSLPVADYDEYKDYPGIKRFPGATTFRMMINGLGTVENQRDKFPTGTWVPEPILANQDFKMAMFFAIDRQKLAEEVLKTSTTQMFLFSDAYLVDAEMGIPYRATDQGMTVGEGLSPSTFGFNPDAASAYWELAIDALVANGTYTAGTAGSYNIIAIDFNIFSGSEAQVLMGEYVKSAFEEVFVSDDHYIKVQITVVPKDFPGIYYDYMMTGEFDLSIGGISGSTLDAAGFLDVFCDDNRGGFTLNWGIDTSVAEIEVKYTDFNGVRHLEMWSFNAITAALNGLVYLQDGEEIDTPNAFVNIVSNVAVDATPTSVPVQIREFTNPAYTNLTYTVQYYDLSAGYLDLEGYVDIPITQANFVISGLEPYYYHYGPDGTLVYKGDYQIVVNFAYVEDLTQIGETKSQWFMLPTISEFSSTNGVSTTGTFTPTTAVVDLGIHQDYTATLTSIDVLVYADKSVAGDAVVDFADLTATTVTGLLPNTLYMLVLHFDDGNWEAIRIRTAAAMVVTVVEVLETSATLSAVINETDLVTRTIDSAVVYLTADDTVVDGAAVVYTDLAAISVTGLTAETTYYVLFTLSDGTEVKVAVVTPATPAE